MENFLTMDQFSYNKENKILTHNPSKIQYSDYVGVGKVSIFGKYSIYDSLSKVHGEEKAKKILKTSIERGNRIHSRIQNSSKILLPDLGIPVAHEVFVYGSFNSLLPDVQGSVDTVYCDRYDDYHIVEIKSKSSFFAWNKYKSKNIGSYYRQVCAYKYLFEQTYDLSVKSCTIVIMFDNDDLFERIPLYPSDFQRYSQEFYNNLRNLTLTL